MKTLRLLLMQTMFWLNISNDVFNIKMRNSYLSFMRLCVCVCVFLGVCSSVFFFFLPFLYFFVAFATAVAATILCVYIVRMANKFERRYKNHNNHTNCCYYNRLWAKCFACVFFVATNTNTHTPKKN